MTDQSEADTVDLLLPGNPQQVLSESISSRVQVDLGALSHPGKVRTTNEDYYLATRFDRLMQVLLTNLPAGTIPERCAETAYGLAVADGMGGQAAGEVASRSALSVLLDLVLRTPDWIMRLDQLNAQKVLGRMEERYRQIKEALADQARHDPSLRGMGTTMTVAASLGADAVLAHVGDTRAYLFHQGQLHPLTRDHTIVQELLEAGTIHPWEAARHPLRHVLTQVIGSEGKLGHVDVGQLRLTDGDQLLLCSDGLTEMVPEEIIAEELQEPGRAAEVCHRLVDLALRSGGKDNVTVVLARYRIPGP